jgi:predicted RNase H-like HicB family nuclease
VRFVDLDDAFTEGATLDEALFNAAEVLSAMPGCR